MIDESLLNRVRETFSDRMRRDMASRVEPVTVAIHGEIDIANSAQMAEAVDTAFSAGAQSVRIDLGAVTFMDSSGIHVLLEVTHRAAAEGRELTIDCPPGHVRRVLEIAGVAHELPLLV